MYRHFKMYRLLKLRKFYPFQSTGACSALNNNLSLHTCSYCEHNITAKSRNFDLPFVEARRFQSTKTNSILLNNMKTKKKRRVKKKYAELLEVTGDSSSEQKASVSNLKAKHFAHFVDQPNINLDQLHNLKKGKGQPLHSLTVKDNTKNLLPLLDDIYEPFVLSVGSEFNLKHLEGLDKSALFNNLDTLQMDKSAIFNKLDRPTLQINKSASIRDSHLLHLDLHLHDSELQHQLTEDLEGIESQHIDIKDADELLHYDEAHFNMANGKLDVQERNSLVTETKVKPKTKPSYKPSLKKHVREQMAKVKQEDLDRAGKEEGLARSLFTYIETCVSCGLLNRSFSTLMFYRSRNKRFKNTPRVSDIKIFNVLLHAYAGKGNITKIKEILQILHEDKIGLDIQSYAACFECIGRLNATPVLANLLSKFAEEMERKGLSLNDLMVKCKYIGDQREVVLGVIRRLEPGFEPNVPPPTLCYSCNLLQDLNVAKGDGYRSPVEDLLTSKQLKELTREQIRTEMKDYIKVKTIEKRTEPNETILYYRSKLEQTQSEWRKTITSSFQRDLNTLRAQHQSFKTFRHVNLYPYLKALDPQQYTDIVLQEIRKLAEGSETYSPTTGQLHRELGNQVRARYHIKYKINSGVMDKVEKLYDQYCDWYADGADGSSPSNNTRQHWQHLVHANQEGPTINADESDKQWPNSVLIGIGKFLYNIIMRDIKIDVNITRTGSKTQHLLPAFYTLFRTQGRVLKEEMKPHPILARLFRGAASEELVFEVTSVPMLSPPLPWSSVNSGGYLVAKTDIIRLPHQAVQQWHRLVETPAPQLYPALDSLNQLGAVPWAVNEPVLDVVMEVFNTGGSMRLDIPEPPSACAPPDSITPEMTKDEKFQVYRNRMVLRRRKAEMYSLWCDALYRLSLANHFRKRIFWLPHNIDFRGRVYPCPPHLNHLGSDMARSILCFAKGEKLGENGLDWLKIHLVNLTGLKKRDPVFDRLIYADEMLPEIKDSAENPLTGRMWWAESEEPWQTLACCMEIDRAIKSGDVANYVCRYPVHQDGSCNGLQHYAALGRDRVGGESVNLTPALRPQDVYSRVAAMVEQERAKDAAEGLKVAQVLDGFIRRKVIKQTVMTTVYGVTRFGARLQIARQLKDIEDFPKEFVWSGSTYLVGKTFDSLREMFTSTKEIQDWFTECARLISQVCGQNVEWVTPLGLPVVQPYNRFNRKFDSTPKSGNKLPEHCSMDMFERPNVMKQKNAFPPNFIHSLDSSHMMLTSLYCERKGITFVSVHDCFWTHPSSVDVMNTVCREQFVSLHSQPILEDLSEFLMQKYSYKEDDLKNDNSLSDQMKKRLNQVLVQLPSKGDFELENVLESVYFFS